MMKKSMKKLGLSICLLATMGLATACGGANNTAADAEGNNKIYQIGISQFADHPSLDNCREGFIEGLKQEGFEEGKNLKIEYQNSQSDIGMANQIAQNFASGNYDLVCGIATPAAQAAFNATEGKNIPVIYTAVSDPIEAKLAKEDKTPVKNATGTSDALPLEEQMAMIRALMPEATKIGILYNTSEINSVSQIALLEEIAPKYGFEIITTGVNTQADLPMAVDSILTKVDCINNLTDNLVVSSLSMILDKANAKGIPVFGSEEEQVKAGCVASQGLDYVDLGVQTGKIAARVLNGEDVKTIPFEIIEESQLIINQQVMERLGMNLPEEISEGDVVFVGN